MGRSVHSLARRSGPFDISQTGALPPPVALRGRLSRPGLGIPRGVTGFQGLPLARLSQALQGCDKELAWSEKGWQVPEGVAAGPRGRPSPRRSAHLCRGGPSGYILPALLVRTHMESL